MRIRRNDRKSEDGVWKVMCLDRVEWKDEGGVQPGTWKEQVLYQQSG